jgi:carbon monoxide dehydrogenase subunit G
MQLTGEQLLPLPRQRVWSALLDTGILRAAIPGCESITSEGNGRFTVIMVAAVGPVRAQFKGKLQQRDLQAPERYTLSFEGDGGMAGFARGSAQVSLSEAEASGAPATRLSYQVEAQIGGRLAQIGSRLVDATAARMSAQFFERLAAVLSAPPAAAAATREQRSPAPHGVPPAVAEAVLHGHAAAGSGLSAPVVIQMPAWTWSLTITVVALLAAWLSTR